MSTAVDSPGTKNPSRHGRAPGYHGEHHRGRERADAEMGLGLGLTWVAVTVSPGTAMPLRAVT
jgi:hypothetical protein